MQHLGQARNGFWQKGFVARELEAGAYLWRVGRGRERMLSNRDLQETIANLMHHTGMSVEEIITILIHSVKSRAKK